MRTTRIWMLNAWMHWIRSKSCITRRHWKSMSRRRYINTRLHVTRSGVRSSCRMRFAHNTKRIPAVVLTAGIFMCFIFQLFVSANASDFCQIHRSVITAEIDRKDTFCPGIIPIGNAVKRNGLRQTHFDRKT